MSEGLAKSLVQPIGGPIQPPALSVVDRIRQALATISEYGNSNTDNNTQNQPKKEENLEWRDVRPGKNLDAYLKSQGWE